MNDPYVKNSDEYNEAYMFGQMLEASIHGRNPQDVIRKEACVEALDADPTMQKAVCKAASYIFKQAGYAGTKLDRVYEAIMNLDGPITKVASDMFITPVLNSLSYFNTAVQNAELEKSASKLPALLKLIPAIAGKGVSSVPSWVQTGFLGAAGTGATLGGLLWVLNRSANQDDADVAAKEEQAAHYRQIADDIRKRIKLESSKDPKTKEIAKKLEEENTDSYII